VILYFVKFLKNNFRQIISFFSCFLKQYMFQAKLLLEIYFFIVIYLFSSIFQFRFSNKTIHNSELLFSVVKTALNWAKCFYNGFLYYGA